MKQIVSLFIFLLLSSGLVYGQQSPEVAKIIEVRSSCEWELCKDFDAIFFVHGIYGDGDTFKNVNFDWPTQIPAVLSGRKIDVYRIEYKTALIAWLKKDIASFDEVVDSIFNALQGHPTPNFGLQRDGLLVRKPYRSVAFIAHSLGGNIVAAYFHTVKSELGHIARAQNSFLITLGTPANGAQLANVALVAKTFLNMRDPLLGSLSRDNTFVRMLARWRNAEDQKATAFRCRSVNLYVAVEGARLAGMKIVSRDSAEEPFRNIAKNIEFFSDLNHSTIAKPKDKNDKIFVWVENIIKNEVNRLNSWSDLDLCDRRI